MQTFLTRRILALNLVSVGLIAQSQTTTASQGVDESNYVLLQPILGRVPLSDSITALPGREGPLLPFGEICRLLAFGIRVDATNGKAEGFFINEKRRFLLNLASGSVEVEGRKSTFTPIQVVKIGQELFVDARLLEAWFPLEAKVNLKAATFVIKPKEKLPIQEQWERDGQYTGGVGKELDDSSIGDYLKTPYSFADMPFADLSVYWNKNQWRPSAQPAASVLLSGDLLWMSATLSASRDQEGHCINPSWTLSREDPHGEILGLLQAKRVEIGNILQPPSLGVAGGLPQGRGLLLDNYPLNYRSKFATRSFTGTLEEGWSVEFYQNSGLVGFQKSGADGRYEFRDVPLRFGLNQFKLVFHGPFGQTRIETARLDINSDQPSPGELFYRLTSVKPLKSDITCDHAGSMIAEETQRKISTLLQMEYGLSKVFSIGAGTARVEHMDGFVHNYDDVGLRAVFPYLSVQINAAHDRAPGQIPGTAMELDFSSGYDYSTFTLQRKDYRNGFHPLDTSDSHAISRTDYSLTRIQWDGTFDWGKQPIAFSLSQDGKKYVDGHWTTTDAVRSTFTFPSFTISPMLCRTAESNQTGPASIDGVLFIAGGRGNYNLQSEVDFSRTVTGTKLTRWGVQADRIVTNGFVYRIGIKGTDASLDTTSVLTGISKLTGRYGYGLDCQYSKASGYSLDLRAQASFGSEPRTGRWISDARPITGQGAISAVAFIDTNGNTRLDPDERILKETQFRVGNQSVENAIQDPQVVFKTAMPRSQDTLVQVDESSLEDPSYHPVVKSLRIVPRPGKVARIDFPVAVYGEIGGTTYLRKAGGTAEFGGLEIELLKANGEQFRVLRSAYDGYFEIRNLPLGDYLLRITPADVARLKLKESPTRKYHIDATRNFFEGQDLTIEPLQSESGELTP